MQADTERILNGEEPLPASASKNYEGNLPKNFTEWLEKNETRIANAKSLPYFLKDNRKLIEESTKTLTALEIAEQRHTNRAAEEVRDIKERWQEREIGVFEKETKSLIGDEMAKSAELTLRIEELNKNKILVEYATTHRDYPMYNGVKRDVNEYVTKSGIKIIASQSETFSERQVYTPEQIARVLEQMPVELRSVIKEVRLCDFLNPDDNYWAKTYNYANFRSYATGWGGVVNFYENNGLLNNDTVLRETLSHEGGHVIDSALGRISDSTLWKKATNFDLYNGIKQKSVTSYGSVHTQEDFAESVKLFLADRKKFSEDFPARYAILSQIIK